MMAMTGPGGAAMLILSSAPAMTACQTESCVMDEMRTPQ